MVELIGAQDRPAPRRHALDRPVPVPRRAHALVLRQRRAQASTTASAARRVGRRDRLRAADRGARLRASALEFLAERYNVELKREDEDPEAEQRRLRRERLLKLLERTATFYASVLWDSPEAAPRARVPGGARPRARRCCASSASATRRARGTASSAAARRDGFDADELMAAGLAQRGRGGSGIYDRFRGRIMFPLADARGRVPGLRCAPAARGRRGPKYLNTSENELFHKGRQLFGIAPGAGRRRQGRPGGRGRGLHRRARAAPGRRQGGRGDHGHRGDPRAAGAAAARPRRTVLLRARRGRRRPGGDGAGRRGAPERRDRAARGPASRGAAIRPTWSSGQGPRRSSRCSAARRLRSPSSRCDATPRRGRPRVRQAAAIEPCQRLYRVIGSVPRRTRNMGPLDAFYRRQARGRSEVLQTFAIRSPCPVRPRAMPIAALVGVPQTTRLPSIEAVAQYRNGPSWRCASRSGRLGKRYLEAPHDDHFSSQPLPTRARSPRRALRRPARRAPGRRCRRSRALITEVVFQADDEPASESVLRLTWLQLELRRTGATATACGTKRPITTPARLWPQREGLRREIDDLMGQTQ